MIDPALPGCRINLKEMENYPVKNAMIELKNFKTKAKRYQKYPLGNEYINLLNKIEEIQNIINNLPSNLQDECRLIVKKLI